VLGLWSYASASTLPNVERRARAVVATRRHTEIGHPHREAPPGAKRRPAFPEQALLGRESRDGPVRAAKRNPSGGCRGGTTKANADAQAKASDLATGPELAERQRWPRSSSTRNTGQRRRWWPGCGVSPRRSRRGVPTWPTATDGLRQCPPRATALRSRQTRRSRRAHLPGFYARYVAAVVATPRLHRVSVRERTGSIPSLT